MGKPAKCLYFPPQTTLSFYSISVQSQQRKPLFWKNNPYSQLVFGKNPYETLTISPQFHVISRNRRETLQNPASNGILT